MGEAKLNAPAGWQHKMWNLSFNRWRGLMLCFVCSSAYAEIGTLVMKPTTDMERAEVSYLKPIGSPKAALVLCPGCNGDGLGMIQQREWQDFANREHLGLMGIHFQSPIDLLSMCQGYYQASKGSGEILLKSIRSIYGRDLPILIYGFSGGAHFTTRFIAWKPERILGWCALGAGVLDQPVPSSSNPPGIMACGEDDSRLGGALVFFKQGRAAQKPWLWIEVPKTGHATSPNLDNFVRSYFTSLLHHASVTGTWVDIDLMKEISREEAQQTPSLSGWLPDRDLFKSWEQFREN
ncbi:MAG: hypothetical protein IAE94_05370 [Chthoniobacterales bacterium]|nr:hypothetical protein [Chthoniobacterales bacterium]